jgi:predicted restriction endonuclease
MANADWTATLTTDPLSNPLDITFSGDGGSLRLLIHARRITIQSRPGDDPSDHGRPPGEMHAQMIFDGDKRGSGIRNTLRFLEEVKTVLFGFYRIDDSDYVIAAYDPQRHREYAYSKSLQVKQQILEKAAKTGIAFQTRANGETIVAFHINEIAEYLQSADDFHNLSYLEDFEDVHEKPDEMIKPVLDQRYDIADVPLLAAETRKQIIAAVSRYIRNQNFSIGIKKVYERCAICGFRYDYLLDAAHIVPVSQGGTDTYDNGLGLCPMCHRMYDKGYILVDKEMNIYMNSRLAEEFQQLGLADSLERVQATLLETLWLPENEDYHPSSENLRRMFEARR